ncbi:hypothetical protein [Mesorhizobium sp. KR2-14]|uniref:DUF883 family protein n=1 Tax=Mesorhizobium sp. KR2-14 TaxID=3156610 RepID=UPI0032B36B87
MASTFSRLRDDSFSRLRNDLTDDLEDQISALRREVLSLKKSLSKRGAAALEDTHHSASEIYDEVMSRMQDAMPHIARRTREVRQAARENPVATTVVGLAVLGLLIGLLARR